MRRFCVSHHGRAQNCRRAKRCSEAVDHRANSAIRGKLERRWQCLHSNTRLRQAQTQCGVRTRHSSVSKRRCPTASAACCRALTIVDNFASVITTSATVPCECADGQVSTLLCAARCSRKTKGLKPLRRLRLLTRYDPSFR